jgi:hypothetical protein
MGCRKSPNEWRMPNEMVMMKAPHHNTVRGDTALCEFNCMASGY